MGGRKAKDVAEVPWSAAIYKRNSLICGGTIISEKLVISASHCFFREQPSTSQDNVVLEDLSLFKVAVGKYFRNINAEEFSKPQFLGISDVFSVPGYDGYMGYFFADFIILVLDSHIIFRPEAMPICINIDTIDLFEEVTVPEGLIGTVAGKLE